MPVEIYRKYCCMLQ